MVLVLSVIDQPALFPDVRALFVGARLFGTYAESPQLIRTDAHFYPSPSLASVGYTVREGRIRFPSGPAAWWTAAVGGRN